MIKNVVSLSEVLKHSIGWRTKIQQYFIRQLESRWQARVVRDTETLLNGQSNLEPLHILARNLRSAEIIERVQPFRIYPDTPPFCGWQTFSKIDTDSAGGASVSDQPKALLKSLTEVLKRHLWKTATDVYVQPRHESSVEIARRGAYVAPDQISGLSHSQQQVLSGVTTSPATKFLWVLGERLTDKRPTFAPVQLFSRAHQPYKHHEPLLRMQVTSGLSVASTQTGARLLALLELIERDAFFVTWLNQIPVPRLDISSYEPLPPSLRTLIGWLQQYRYEYSVLQLLTDAPTHAIAVILTDTLTPARIHTVGLASGANLLEAVEEALLEALRGRLSARQYEIDEPAWDKSQPVSAIDQKGRLRYWSQPEHAVTIEAWASGPLQPVTDKTSWWNETEEAHYKRLLDWCAEKNHEPIGLSFGSSRHNPTPLHIESVVIPGLFPHYTTDQYQHHEDRGRLHTVPMSLGYTPRKTPYFEVPHPFY